MIPSFKAEDVPHGPGYGATGSQAFPAHRVGILRGCIQGTVRTLWWIRVSKRRDENARELADLTKLVSKKRLNLPTEPLKAEEASAILSYIDSLEEKVADETDRRTKKKEPHPADLKTGLDKLIGIMARPSSERASE